MPGAAKTAMLGLMGGVLLSPLDGLFLGKYRLQLQLGQTNRFGARYFQIFLQDSQGQLGLPAVVVGLASAGSFPSHNWVEVIASNPQINFDSLTADLEQESLFHRLFQHLAQLIPPGGHLIVEYESPQWRSSKQTLSRGFPPILTPLGELLFNIGCGDGFKDIHFAEGGREGAPKLIGYKALNPDQAHRAREKLAQELQAFLSQPPDGYPQLRQQAEAWLARWGYQGRK